MINPPPTRTLLIVDASSDQRADLLEQFQTKGISVITATDPAVALATFEMAVPDVVLTDLYLPDMAGLTLAYQIKRRRPDSSVIVMGERHDHGTVISALKAGALDYLSKPISMEELSRALERAYRVIPSKIEESAGIERIEHLVVTDNNPAYVETIVSKLVSMLSLPIPEPQRLHLRSALHELLLNAMEHGCLEISFRAKHEALACHTYDQLIAERRLDPRLKSRRVRIRTIYDRFQRQLEYRVTDGGNGFDWKPHLHDGTEAIPAHSGCGRGIFVARALFPNLSYNDQGNEAVFSVPLP